MSRAQLVEPGLGAGAIKHRVSLGRLHTVHRGVYAVGHRALRREAWWTAAVLAAGPGAALSHRSAAELWQLRNGSRARIDVSVPRHRRSTARLEVHCVAMQPDEVTMHRQIPVTTPARTLLDLAGVLRQDHLEAAFDEAEFRRLGSPTSLEALLERYPRRRGTRPIRAVLANHRRNGATVTRSLLERRLVALVQSHGLPRPAINRIGPEGEVDANGPSSAWSSSATGSPRTGRVRRSRWTERGTAPSRWPAGAWSGSRGASSRTTPI